MLHSTSWKNLFGLAYISITYIGIAYTGNVHDVVSAAMMCIMLCDTQLAPLADCTNMDMMPGATQTTQGCTFAYAYIWYDTKLMLVAGTWT